MENRRKWIIAAMSLVLAVSSAAGTGLAQQSSTEGSPEIGERTELPVTDVVLFASGVGYISHSGQITGETTLRLPIRERELNDLLKSLVVSDPSPNARIGVRYPTRNPLGRILSGFSIDLSSVASLSSLLDRARGEHVTVEAGETFTGRLFAVEQRSGVEGEPYLVIVLYGEQGLQSVRLDEAASIRFSDARVQAEVDEALAAIAANRQAGAVPVTIDLRGDGTREATVGYVREVPVWKTSYRLVLDDSGEAMLHGWGIVENTTEEDWRGVRLIFVAGQPLSFYMNLYDPVYADRPELDPPSAPNIAAPEYEPGRAPTAAQYSAFAADRVAGSGLEEARERADPAPQATATASGGYFEYRVDAPVFVGRHQAAMIPILVEPIAADRVSIYDRSVLAPHPLRGALLENTTGLHLAAGPLTVMHGDSYAGDARFSDILPDQSRQIAYAIDIDLQVDVDSTEVPVSITRISIADGVMVVTRLRRQRTEYAIESSADEARTLIIEHPRVAGWELKQPEDPWEVTSSRYRLREQIAAGEQSVVAVESERIDQQSVRLLDLGESQLAYYISQAALSREARDALQRIVELRSERAAIRMQITEAQTQVDEIYVAQERISRNMEPLDRDTELYDRYLEQLLEQEEELDALSERLRGLREQEAQKQQEIERFISSLELE